MQLPILHGCYTDAGADFRTSYPLNLMPVPKSTGISQGYLRTAEGMVEFANSIYSGASDRGAINWNGICYRVIGEWLTRVNANGTIDYLGAIENDGKPVVMVNSFDRLAIAAAGRLYYWPISGGVSFVTDVDLGTVLDVVWTSGYFMTTDGANLVVTDLNDPFSVNPLKYGSSEVLPDPINSLLAIRNEVAAINRYSTEYFQNVGGAGFPYQRIEGAMIPKGSIGRDASCYYLDTFAFVGGGQNEGLSVWLAGMGRAEKLATAEIERILQDYTEAELATISVEARADKMHQLLYVHLPDKTLLYDHAASQELGVPAWTVHTSGPSGDQAYRARNFVRAYDKWLFGDNQSLKIGYLTTQDARQFGETVPAEFDTQFAYADGRGAIIHELELVRLPGRETISPASAPATVETSIALSWSDDGVNWSQPRIGGAAKPGQRDKRAVWRRIGRMSHYRTFRFRMMNNPYPDAFARLEAQVEPLGA